MKHENLTPKPTARMKRDNIAATNSQGIYNAEVFVGKSINIYGTCTNHVKGPQHFVRSFKIGDRAEYDSWNLKYIGTIVAIGPKTITIERGATGERVCRLDLFTFVDRNWDFNETKAEAHNAEEMQCI